MDTRGEVAPIGAPHKLSRAATLWISLLATCVVILLPTAVVSITVRATAWTPHPAAMWASTGVMSFAILMIGTHWWMRQPGSTTMSFGELMLWRWVRRRRADGVVQGSAKLLDPTRVHTRSRQLEMLRELNAALEIRDPYTRGHSRRVERHAYRTALAMHRSVEDIFNLRVAASLHDIGKIEVPIEVIRKQGPLDDEEWALMKSHPGAGAQMIANIGHEALVLAVRHHHERWDGKGYPDGLAGEDIPLHARIISVCDTFDAITSTRSYRAKSSREEAIEIIKKNSGSQFDPAVVKAFLAALPRGVPGVAALSWLSLPALQKGIAQAGSMFREAGVAGMAGALATGGIFGTVATTAVNPAKYLNRPAIARAQADEHASTKAKRHAAQAGAAVLGTSVANADGEASRGPTRSSGAGVLTGKARATGERQAASGRRSAAKKKSGGPDGSNGKSESAGKPADKEQPSRGKPDDSGVVASTGSNGKPGKADEAVEDSTDPLTDVVEDSAPRTPPGQAKKEAPAAPEDVIETSDSVAGGGSEPSTSKGRAKSK